MFFYKYTETHLPNQHIGYGPAHWTNAGLMLAQRRRRWANIKPALVQRQPDRQN